MAPQLTVTKGFERRSPAPWMARAISSLPTPDSPSIEDRDLRGGGALAEADDALHRRAAGDDVAEGEGAGGAALHARDLAFQRAELERVLDGDLQALGRGRLDDEIDRAGAHGADHRVDAAMGGLHDDGKLAVHLAQLGENPHAVEIGHDEVEDDQRDRVAVGAGKQGDGSFAAFERDGRVAHALNRCGQQAALDGIVVDDEDGGRHERAAGSLSGVKLSLCGTIHDRCRCEIPMESMVVVNVAGAMIGPRQLIGS